ncbi:MAG: terminase large subunit domain-containing protein [Gemmataceae bacterium]
MNPTLPTATDLLRRLGVDADPWQIDVVEGGHPRMLLNCCRQAGKSTAVAMLSLHEALLKRDCLVLLLSRSLRQSSELFRRIVEFHLRLGGYCVKRRTCHELQFTNLSRIVSLPCQPDTIRGFANVHMLVIDEAARVPDDLYRTVRPMLAVSGGRLICLSTPYGKRGFFYKAWAQGGDEWNRIEIPASRINRISPAFLDEERRNLGESWYRQEYCCSFEALEGLVYPDFKRCIMSSPEPQPQPEPQPGLGPLRRIGLGLGLGLRLGFGLGKQGKSHNVPAGRPVGGIDFGFRNPFAAVWGVVDRDDILWLTSEHYCRNKPLSYHIKHLPKNVHWYADPAGAGEIEELRCAGFTVSRGQNALRPGIAAVSARLEEGTLRILEGQCPNLLAEAELYRYSTEAEDKRAETPVDDNNHALAALRYLISQLDTGKLGRRNRPASAQQEKEDKETRLNAAQKKWMSWRNEALWRPAF